MDNCFVIAIDTSRLGLAHIMLMIPNEDETAVHGCHGRGDMVMRKCEVLAIPQSWYMCFSTEEGYFGHALFHIIINRDQVEVNRLSQ